MVIGAAAALARLSKPPGAGPRNPPGGAWVRLLRRTVWSKMIVIAHVVPAQNASCAAASAGPPALTNPMSRVVLSDDRRTWYRAPLYASNSARVVLCAATHGVPPAA